MDMKRDNLYFQLGRLCFCLNQGPVELMVQMACRRVYQRVFFCYLQYSQLNHKHSSCQEEIERFVPGYCLYVNF